MKGKKDNRLIVSYKGLKGAASIPTNDLVPRIRRCRNHHSFDFSDPHCKNGHLQGHVFLKPLEIGIPSRFDYFLR